MPTGNTQNLFGLYNYRKNIIKTRYINNIYLTDFTDFIINQPVFSYWTVAHKTLNMLKNTIWRYKA